MKNIESQINSIIMEVINNTAAVIDGDLPDEWEVREAVAAQKEEIIKAVRAVEGIKIATVRDPYIYPHILIAYHNDNDDCIYGIGLSDDMPYLTCDDIWTFSTEGLKEEEEDE